tara:strand:- start:796 stop:1020 length:225 start_codon:yes stop_codon:yes gene_type:complete
MEGRDRALKAAGRAEAIAELRTALAALTDHLEAIDGGIAAAPSAGPVLCQLYALGGMKLVRRSDDREPIIEAAA